MSIIYVVIFKFYELRVESAGLNGVGVHAYAKTCFVLSRQDRFCQFEKYFSTHCSIPNLAK